MRVEVSPNCFFISSMNVSALDWSPGCVRVEVSPNCFCHFKV